MRFPASAKRKPVTARQALTHFKHLSSYRTAFSLDALDARRFWPLPLPPSLHSTPQDYK